MVSPIRMTGRSASSDESAHGLTWARLEVEGPGHTFIRGDEHKRIAIKPIAGGQVLAGVLSHGIDPGDALGGGAAVQDKTACQQHLAAHGFNLELVTGNRGDCTGCAVSINRIEDATVLKRDLFPVALKGMQVGI